MIDKTINLEDNITQIIVTGGMNNYRYVLEVIQYQRFGYTTFSNSIFIYTDDLVELLTHLEKI